MKKRNDTEFLCRICKSPLKAEEILGDVKADVNMYFKKPCVSKGPEVPFYYCKECAVGQIPYLLNEDFYQSYNVSYKEDMVAFCQSNGIRKQDYYEEVAKQIVEFAKEHRNKFIDIGCGEGFFLAYMKPYFQEIMGVEPSRGEWEKAVAKGFRVENTFFDENWKEEGYSAFFLSQVLEHLENPFAVLKKIYEVLEENGVGYVDVPNGQKIIEKGEYFNLFLEHINYWTIQGLAKALWQAGFTVLEIKEVSEGNHIAAYVKKECKRKGFEEEKRKNQKKLEEDLKKYARLSLWGAGVKGSVFVRNLEAANIHYFFDGNQNLEGLYVAGFEKEITYPTKEKVLENDAILITAIEHKKAIEQTLCQMGFQGKILAIDD